MNQIKTKNPTSEVKHYVQTIVFGAIVFGVSYWYTSWMGIPNVLNKTLADTAVILIGLSMLLTSICYFWNFLDAKIIYRKYLGLVGFAFAVTHIIFSYSSLLRLFEPETWMTGKMWPMFTAFIATVIFAIMALISNQFFSRILGGKLWKGILRLGYIALLLIFAHVFLLKSARWITWWQEDMERPASLSLIVSGFIILVLVMRILLAMSLSKRKNTFNNSKNLH